MRERRMFMMAMQVQQLTAEQEEERLL